MGPVVGLPGGPYQNFRAPRLLPVSLHVQLAPVVVASCPSPMQAHFMAYLKWLRVCEVLVTQQSLFSHFARRGERGD